MRYQHLFNVSRTNLTKMASYSMVPVAGTRTCKNTIVFRSHRLYHALGSTKFDNGKREIQSSHLPSPNVYNSHVINRTPCRTIFLSKIAGWTIETVSKGPEGINAVVAALRESYVVSSVKSIYLWTEATTGLPWWVTIVLITLTLRTVFHLPGAIRMERVQAARENCFLELLPEQLALSKGTHSREALREFYTLKKNLMKENNCQFSKVVTTTLYQGANVVLLSLGLRECLLTGGHSGIREAVLPWGAVLGYPDIMFVLPITNFLLNLILIELDVHKSRVMSNDAEMAFRQCLTKVPREVNKMEKINFLFRRATCLLLLAVYISMPSAVNLLWATMLLQTLSIRLMLNRPSLRRRLGIPLRSYESETPHREFLAHLGSYLEWKSKSGRKT